MVSQRRSSGDSRPSGKLWQLVSGASMNRFLIALPRFNWRGSNNLLTWCSVVAGPGGHRRQRAQERQPEMSRRRAANAWLAAPQDDHYVLTMVRKPTARNQIAAAAFKAKCLQIMDRVSVGKQPVVVTKRGKPLVRIVPVDEPDAASIFGCLAGDFQIVGDIEGPVLPASLWASSK
jgi:prevent-host-death family protein